MAIIRSSIFMSVSKVVKIPLPSWFDLMWHLGCTEKPVLLSDFCSKRKEFRDKIDKKNKDKTRTYRKVKRVVHGVEVTEFEPVGYKQISSNRIAYAVLHHYYSSDELYTMRFAYYELLSSPDCCE